MANPARKTRGDVDQEQQQSTFPVGLNVRLTIAQHKTLSDTARVNHCTLSQAARMVLELGFEQLEPHNLLWRAGLADRGFRIDGGDEQE